MAIVFLMLRLCEYVYSIIYIFYIDDHVFDLCFKNITFIIILHVQWRTEAHDHFKILLFEPSITLSHAP